MIPKILHWIWLGDSPPSIVLDNVATWKAVYPDWEIKFHGNEILKRYTLPSIIKEAIFYKRWALVSDYIRLKVLFEWGGVYCDGDIKHLKPFSNDMLDNDFFIFSSHYDKRDKYIPVSDYCFASNKETKIVQLLIDRYDTLKPNTIIYKLTIGFVLIAAYIYGYVIAQHYDFFYDINKTFLFEDNIVIYPNYKLTSINFYNNYIEDKSQTFAVHLKFSTLP